MSDYCQQCGRPHADNECGRIESEWRVRERLWDKNFHEVQVGDRVAFQLLDGSIATGTLQEWKTGGSLEGSHNTIAMKIAWDETGLDEFHPDTTHWTSGS